MCCICCRLSVSTQWSICWSRVVTAPWLLVRWESARLASSITCSSLASITPVSSWVLVSGSTHPDVCAVHMSESTCLCSCLRIYNHGSASLRLHSHVLIHMYMATHPDSHIYVHTSRFTCLCSHVPIYMSMFTGLDLHVSVHTFRHYICQDKHIFVLKAWHQHSFSMWWYSDYKTWSCAVSSLSGHSYRTQSKLRSTCSLSMIWALPDLSKACRVSAARAVPSFIAHTLLLPALESWARLQLPPK